MKYPPEVAQELMRELPRLAYRRRADEFDAATFAALYFIHWQIALHGQQFASRTNKNDPRPMATEWLRAMASVRGEDLHRFLLDSLQRYQFYGVIGNVPIALVRWLHGDWPLILREDIPTPVEILRMQARGYRAVTAITEPARLCQPVLHKPNAFAFFLHDLEHAYKFFHSPTLHAGQRDFFTLLENAFDDGVFVPYFDDAEFIARFHYLMSDMNTHPEHSRQYLRAILVEYHQRRECETHSEPLSFTAERRIEEIMHAMGARAPRMACV